MCLKMGRVLRFRSRGSVLLLAAAVSTVEGIGAGCRSSPQDDSPVCNLPAPSPVPDASNFGCDSSADPTPCCGVPAPASMPTSVDVPDAGSSGGVHWSYAGNVVTIGNGVVELRFDGPSGALLGLRDVARNVEMVSGAAPIAQRPLAAVVDARTTDLWSAQDTCWQPGPTARSMTLSAQPDGATLSLAYDAGAGVHFVQHVELRTASPVSEWTTDVTIDAGAQAVALGVQSPRVVGVALGTSGGGETLAWPWHEGVLVPNPGDATYMMEYPSPASMQWEALYDDGGGVYLGVKDTSGAPKDLRFGRDPHDGAREMSVTFWPYVTPGKAYTSPVVELGISDASGWHWGANRYRDWLLASGMYKTHASWVAELPAYEKTYNQQLNGKLFDYCQDTTLLVPPSYAGRGLHTIAMYGWSRGGLDTYYPDYDWLAGDSGSGVECQQESDLSQALNVFRARDPSAHVIFYLNAHSASTDSSWYARSGAEVLPKTVDGSLYPCACYDDPDACAHANASVGVSCTADGAARGPMRWLRTVCPFPPAWGVQLANVAQRLIAAAPGVSAGVYWDQLAEVPPEHCYDRNHGHATPRSAGVEGNGQLMVQMRALFDAALGSDQYLFAAEGVSDFYGRFVDIQSPAPTRPLGYDYASHCLACDSTPDFDRGQGFPCGSRPAPEIARYTLPGRILGLQRDIPPAEMAADPGIDAGPRGDGLADSFAWAFVLAEPLRSDEYPDTPNARAFPRYTAAYDANKDLYAYGRFLDTDGLQVSLPSGHPPGQVLASVVANAAGNRAAVQLWNRTAAGLPVTVAVHFSPLGLPAHGATAAVDLFADVPVPFAATIDGARFTLTVPAHDVAAIALSP